MGLKQAVRLTSALEGGVVGEGTTEAGSLQSHAGVLALPHQSPVQLDQQALVQIPGAAVHHLAQGHLHIVCPRHLGHMQVQPHIVV